MVMRASKGKKEIDIKEVIKKELPEIVKSDPEFRLWVIDVTHNLYADKSEAESKFDKILEELRRDREEQAKRWEEDRKRWEENNKKWEENNRKWEENNKRLEEMQKEWNRRWEENQKTINRILDELKESRRRFDSSIGALGARWGIQTEESFREALKGILRDVSKVQVERYLGYDEEGIVFGRPDQIELDLIVKDGILIIGEIKSSMSKPDVYILKRKVKFYEKKHGRKPDKVVIISPMVSDEARKLAEEFGYEIYSYAGDLKV